MLKIKRFVRRATKPDWSFIQDVITILALLFCAVFGSIFLPRWFVLIYGFILGLSAAGWAMEGTVNGE